MRVQFQACLFMGGKRAGGKKVAKNRLILLSILRSAQAFA
jgi:hypothetical protein